MENLWHSMKNYGMTEKTDKIYCYRYECICIAQFSNTAYKLEEAFYLNAEETDDVFNTISNRLRDKENECKRRDEWLKYEHVLRNLVAMIIIDENAEIVTYLQGEDW